MEDEKYYQEEEQEHEDQETLPQSHESELTFTKGCRKHKAAIEVKSTPPPKVVPPPSILECRKIRGQLRALFTLYDGVFVLGFILTPLVFLYLGTTYHDVVEQNRDRREENSKRRDERCVYCTQNEAKFWVFTGHLGVGVF